MVATDERLPVSTRGVRGNGTGGAEVQSEPSVLLIVDP